MKLNSNIFKTIVFLFLMMIIVPNIARAENATIKNPENWKSASMEGRIKTILYFFWSEGCPHCRKAHPFIDSIPQRMPFIELRSIQIDEKENREKFTAILEETDAKSFGVPAFSFCGRTAFGYSSDETTGETLQKDLERCHNFLWQSPAKIEAPVEIEKTTDTTDTIEETTKKEIETEEATEVETKEETTTEEEPLITTFAAESETTVNIPFIGSIDLSKLSLPIITISLAGLDAFNPCAFFVLLFLLSLMVNAKSRSKMLLVGGIFVLFSGIIYFMFMAAWLNIFKIVGDAKWVTIAAGSLALIAGILNIKDFFFFGKGPSLSISENKKPGLFKRMNSLVAEKELMPVLLGTVIMAIVVNSYELLCTAGFPMVFTRILTLKEISGSTHYLFLALYNVVYIMPLLAIVIMFAVTLGKRKLSENEGRFLKLLSGIMMGLLGGVLLVAPHILESVLVSVVLLLTAVIISFVISFALRNRD